MRQAAGRHHPAGGMHTRHRRIASLAVANLGLGTCWIPAFDRDAVSGVLRLPAEVVPVIFTPLGYLAGLPGPKVRKPLVELVRYEHW